ncbi:hypothetical protein Daus18300_000461 [Diaporthe australafricana]|uniref:CCCH zinc finger and RRM domain-containing protein n=1 Tax=Diaporthe australafricana TaxID=127596 RepID=A0ABR3Y4S3_9PEZI
MLFPDEDSPLLKAWVVKRLENTSDADADVLADFVLALLHHDDASEDVRAKCMSEMGNFLTEDPSSFVNDLFEIIQYRSYVPGAAPPPKAVSAVAPLPNIPNPEATSTNQSTIPTGPSGGSARKRGFQDRGDFDAPTGRDQLQGGRMYKQPRRGGGFGGRKGYVDPDRPQPMSQEQYGFQNTPQAFAQPGQVPQMPQFDPSNPLEAMRQLQQISQQMGLSMPPFADYSQQQLNFQQNTTPQQGRRRRCWDFDRKGCCPRGLKCKFDHSTGTEPAYNLPAPQMSGHIPLSGEGRSGSQSPTTPTETKGLNFGLGFYSTPFGVNAFFESEFNDLFQLPNLTQEAEYDPSSATLSQPPQFPQFPQNPPPHHGNGHHNQNRNNRQGQQRRKTAHARAPFSAEGPVHDRTQTKVVVESIPEENFSKDQVRDFFAQFGTIEEITMMEYKRLAIIQFDNWASANAAYKSPKAIFDNRFVKVFWYKDEKHGDIANGGDGANGVKNGYPANGIKSEESAGVKLEDIDMDEFTRRQEEAQKAYEEKTAKNHEIEKQREELEKKQKELQARQAAEKQRLMEKLAGSRKSSIEPASSDAAAAEEKGGEASKTEALKATLAKLRGEAEAMGIDLNAQQQEDGTSTLSTYYSGYSRGGRGGYFRGRGAYAPRGSFRGGVRGGRGNVHAAYAAFSLDNRPKTVAISGVDFSAPEKDEALRRHLFVYGEGVAQIQTTPTVTHLSFSDRKSAETFFNSLSNSKIPGINDGGAAVELSWVAGSAAPLPGSTTSSVNLTSGGGPDSAMADADGGGGDDEHQHQGGGGGEDGEDGTKTGQGGGGAAGEDAGAQQGQSQQAQHQESGEAKAEVDYDVAGENEWDE